jgi:acetyl-CoA acetyltransferase
MSSIHIVGIGMTRLGKFPERSVKDMTRECVSQALADAGCDVAAIDAAWFSNTRQPLMEGQNVVRGQIALADAGVTGIPIVNVENACASASTALREAYAHLRAGMARVALVVGVDKMFFPDNPDAMFRCFLGGTDIHALEDTKARIAEVGRGIGPQSEQAEAIGLRSFFMDIYAAFARQHMRLFGTTQRQLAIAAAKNHHHSTMNPLSQFQKDMTTDEVLRDKPVQWPLTRSMCAPISDGAAAVVLCTDSALWRFDRRRSVEILAISLVSALPHAPDDYEQHVGRRAALAAYHEAGIGPDDVGLAEVHDACSFAEILQIENLGFCARGHGGEMTESGATRLGGSLPVNPSGGLVSKGHPVGATGLIQIHELVTQLRGEARRRQVENVRIAVAENGGGFLGVEEAATTVSVLRRG